ncbi:hypothetical protein BCV70DRAFT_108621 [Testicularia cyperi]|uniref:VASt domain-containing protein n=1 Tax=Testicularia cyperi TaxID=1882483 RepID=A0A317XPU8_9BASI|nr:hypothetical protein BCV70DRAFT_108621 [Testicularia cyperi]
MSFKNIFRSSNKDQSASSSSLTGDHKRSRSAGGPVAGSQSEILPPLQPPYANSSLSVSPLSTPAKLPAIDVVDLSDNGHPKNSQDSEATTLRAFDPQRQQYQYGSVRSDYSANGSIGRSMPRPSSSNHGPWRSETGGSGLVSGGGKVSRRSSKVDRSDDGHGRNEPLNRHELMRRAMATAQDSILHSDGDSVFEDDDHMSNSHHSHGAPPSNYRQPQQAAPTTPVIVRQSPSSEPQNLADRPGDGSLSIEAFGEGESHTVSANQRSAQSRPSTSPPAVPPMGPMGAGTAPGLAGLGVRNSASQVQMSPTLQASSTMPTLVTPSPIRPELPRSDSLEEIINQQGNSYLPSRDSDPAALAHAQLDPHRHSPQRSSTMMEKIHPQATNAPFHGMTKSATSSALLRPTDVPSDGSPRRPSDAGSVSSLSPGPFQRLRKNSDSSAMGILSKGKKSAPVPGIAGALAASGLAGMGVGHAAALQQSQDAISAADVENAAKAAKRKESKKVGFGEDGAPIGNGHVSGFQGGIYRDPSTGTVVEKDQHGNPFRPAHPTRDRSVSSFLSYDGSVASERSSASGLGAAAGFGAASAALLASIGGVPGMPSGPSPLLTPEGIGAVGGLVPPNGADDHVDGEASWPEDMGPQITGFAVASSKRNNEFHQLFPQVPEDDYLIEDYGCALVRDILIQGRLYISENHLCFKANIFGWVTNVVLPFSEVISIEKRMTAFVIPNAIQIATLQSKHNFTSFLSRDATYDLIVNIWKLSHPGVPIAAADQADLTDEYSEIEDDADQETLADSKGTMGAEGDGGQQQQQSSSKEGGDSKPSKRARLKRKFKGTKNGVRDENLAAVAAAAARSGTPLIPQSRSPAPGGKRVAHRKTSCPCEDNKEHLSTVALDTTYPTVPEKIYNLLFTSGFMKDFWTQDQKLTDLQMSDWCPNPQSNNMLSRNISYIKPLAGGFGPKQTKCNLTDETIHVDFDNYVVTLTTTRTPDVPSGGSFSVKTRTCITWEGTGNVSRVYVTCQVEWTGRSMIRGIIDKACIDGQKQYYKDLDDAVRRYLTEHTSEFKEEGDDAAAVEEIARAATPGPGHRGGSGAGAGGDARNGGNGGGSGDSKSGSAGGSDSSGGGILGMLQDGLGMVGDLLGGAVEMVAGDGGPSVKTLVFSAVIFVLLLLNIFTLRSNSASKQFSASSRTHLEKMAKEGVNRGYFDDSGYYGPLSPRRSVAEAESGSGRGFDRIFAPNVYITPPGGNAASPEAIAATVREVLQGFLESNLGRDKTFGADQGSDAAKETDPESIQRLLNDAEARVEKLRREMDSLTKGRKSEL